MRTWQKLAVAIVAVLVVIAIVQAQGGEDTATARSFLRELLRALF